MPGAAGCPLISTASLIKQCLLEAAAPSPAAQETHGRATQILAAAPQPAFLNQDGSNDD